MLETWEEANPILLTDCEKRFSIATPQLKIGSEILPTVGTCHEHATDIMRKSQFLSTIAAMLNGVFIHRFKKAVYRQHQ